MNPADDAHELNWISSVHQTMGRSHIKIIISTLPGQCLDRARLLGAVEMDVPVLGDADRALLVRSTLGKFHKKLTENEDDKFLGNQVCFFVPSVFVFYRIDGPST
jgi:hypothetical protein